MVGLSHDPNLEEGLNQQSPKLKHSDDPPPLDSSVTELDDFYLSFADSFLDFDSASDWMEDNPGLVMDVSKPNSEKADSLEMQYAAVQSCSGTTCGDDFLPLRNLDSSIKEDLDVDDIKPRMGKSGSVKCEVGPVGPCRETISGDGIQTLRNLDSSIKEDLDMDNIKPRPGQSDSVKSEVGPVDPCRETTSGDGFQTLGNLDASIEEELGKFSLEGGLEVSVATEATDRENLEIAVYDVIGEIGVDPASASGNGSRSSEQQCKNENFINNGEGTRVNDEPLKNVEETLDINETGSRSREIVAMDGVGTNSNQTQSDGEESDSASDSDTATTSSSSSSSSDDDEEEEKQQEEEEEEEEEDKDREKEKELEKDDMEGDIDVEEGEIRESDVEQMVAWSDGEDDEENGGAKGPIKSKNELKVLPPVPPVNAVLQPHHCTLPVGVISSIIGTQVIVECVEKHNPLNEGSILWITESRSPLGIVDEIFGPVKNPYYIVRYNAESEVPTGVKQGTSVSFVPEFANHVLNDCNLYKKGYDASGDNDEEVSDEFEFSDDEKEAEYRRMQKMTKRGTNDSKVGNKKKDNKKFRKHGGKWQNGQQPTQETPGPVCQLPSNQNQHSTPPLAAPLDQGNHSHTFGTGHIFTGSPGLVPPFPQPVQVSGLVPTPGGVWTSGIPCEQQQGILFPNGVPTNGIPWVQQKYQIQMPSMNIGPFQQQFVPSQGPSSNFVLPVGQSNFSARPALAPWPGYHVENGFNLPYGMGLQCQQAPMPLNPNEQLRPLIPGNLEVPQKFNQGRYHGNGRRSYNRGGGRFGGGRGRQQSK
ncbi:hypothetical protein NMG60_11035540 [Bertholletia excelsa]